MRPEKQVGGGLHKISGGDDAVTCRDNNYGHTQTRDEDQRLRMSDGCWKNTLALTPLATRGITREPPGKIACCGPKTTRSAFADRCGGPSLRDVWPSCRPWKGTDTGPKSKKAIHLTITTDSVPKSHSDSLNTLGDRSQHRTRIIVRTELTKSNNTVPK